MFYTKTDYIFCLYFRTEQANSNLLERLLRNKLPKAPLTVGVTSNDSEERASAFTDKAVHSLSLIQRNTRLWRIRCPSELCTVCSHLCGQVLRLCCGKLALKWYKTKKRDVTK